MTTGRDELLKPPHDAAAVGSTDRAEWGVGCPPAEDLEALERGTTPPDLTDRLHLHLDDCPECRRILAAIAAPPLAADLVAEPPPGRKTQVFLAGLLRSPPQASPLPEVPPAIEGYDGFEEVGRGGMGVVWRATDTRLGRPVAIKVLPQTAALSPAARAIAEREARALARIVHPNIVRILALAESAGAPALVMEWLDGDSLAARGARGGWPVRDAAGLVRDLATAVASLHARGIVHGDITPANVLLVMEPAGGAPTPKLIDFGLAHGEGDRPDGGARPLAVGTPAFMAPEQTGLDPTLGGVGPATDIHALGALLFWLLSGTAPFEAATTPDVLRRAERADAIPLATFAPHAPADLIAIVSRSVARCPADRYASASAFADDLSRFLVGRPVRARPIGPLERCLKWIRRHPAIATLIAVVTLAAAAALAGALHHVRSLEFVNRALVTKTDDAVAAAALARESFRQLTDSTATRFLARGSALDADDRDHLRRVRDRYLRWPLEPDEEAALHFRADGLARTAKLFDMLHWQDDALETVRACRESLAELERRGQATAEERARRLLLLHVERVMLAQQGRVDEAVVLVRETIAAFHAASASDPAIERDLAVAWGDLGNLEGAAGRNGESRAAHETALSIVDRHVAAAPGDPHPQERSLLLLYNAAISPAFAGDLLARRALLTTLVERATTGLERFPERKSDFGRGLLLGLSVLADTELRAGRAEAALEAARTRRTIAGRLAAEMNPSQLFIDEQISAAAQAFLCLEALGRPGDARADLEEADALATTALREQPAVMQRTWTLVEILLTRARMETAAGRRAEAIALYRRIEAALRPWGAADGAPGPFQVRIEEVAAQIARLEADETTATSSPAATDVRR